MDYHYSKIVPLDFDAAIAKVTEELKKEGFGILTEIDVQATLKKKLDVEFRPYRILGACNPHFAYQAFQTEDHIGVLMPCNVIVQDRGANRTEVSAVNPMSSMQSVRNPSLGEVATEVTSRLRKVIDSL
jgi:uncharacterized protein (DUF302 family)